MGTLPTRTAPRRRRRLLLAVAALAMVGLAAGQLSLALFTDQETVAATFGTGSIILDDVKIDALTLTTGSMMPGAMSPLTSGQWPCSVPGATSARKTRPRNSPCRERRSTR